MQSLVTYSGSSDSDDDDWNDEPKRKLAKCDDANSSQIPNKLPKAVALLGARSVGNSVEDSDDVADDPAQHGGRVRSFKHERGNWPSYVYTPVDPSLLEDIQEAVRAVCDDVVALNACADLHISLSRTVVLQYHLIDSFAKTLETSLQQSLAFKACLRGLKIYTNDERTRTFIAFQMDELYHDRMRRLLTKVDVVMREFKLPAFYQDPSFHVSILWCLGDEVDLLTAQMPQLLAAVAASAMDNDETLSFDVRTVHCKCGNKDFQFKLR